MYREEYMDCWMSNPEIMIIFVNWITIQNGVIDIARRYVIDATNVDHVMCCLHWYECAILRRTISTLTLRNIKDGKTSPQSGPCRFLGCAGGPGGRASPFRLSDNDRNAWGTGQAQRAAAPRHAGAAESSDTLAPERYIVLGPSSKYGESEYIYVS